MTPDTPLTEVAHLLPTESAERLLHLKPILQQAVLSDIRMIICRWEQSGVDLDPITFSKVLAPVVELTLVSNLAIYVLTNRSEDQS